MTPQADNALTALERARQAQERFERRIDVQLRFDSSFKRQKRPCVNCPFRRDVEPGEFPIERYEALRETCRSDTNVQAPLGAPMFACHKSPDGGEFACAGWLAVEGVNHIGVRVAVACGDLPAEALHPADGWPELFSSYEQVQEVMGG